MRLRVETDFGIFLLEKVRAISGVGELDWVEATYWEEGREHKDPPRLGHFPLSQARSIEEVPTQIEMRVDSYREAA